MQRLSQKENSMAPHRPETLQEWLARWGKRRLRAFENYQSTGHPRYDAQLEECELVVDALMAKIAQSEERDFDVKKRMTNCDAVIDKLIRDTYSKDEVIRLLKDAVWW